MANLVSSITQPTGRTFFSFLRRNSDEFYWDTDDSEFSTVDLGTANEATREPYRVTYAEDPDVDGKYDWTIDVTDFLNGSYTYVSQELIGETEYDEVLAKTITITNGAVVGGLLSASLTHTAGKTLFSFVKRVKDGLYWNTDTESFDLFDVSTAVEATRADFRVAFAEDPAGTYSWTLDVSAWNAGFYTLSTRELAGTTEIVAGEDSTVLVSGGEVTEGIALGEVGINHDTGGDDNLQYVEANGDGIEDAIIRLYLKADYDAGSLDVIKGVSMTNADGRWQTPVFLGVGNTYTVVFTKIGSFGPDTLEVTI
ncbi:hypothetical protein CMI47_20045 [Candidatus Pacearchaeota archaeon]|nr:hypothetical protein [Candidatus Pacearchaeota archaeon]|tara:strand:+ start:2239 stop:3171 length:933 start_codon:yes stop_codon:yes gene_type:complete